MGAQTPKGRLSCLVGAAHQGSHKKQDTANALMITHNKPDESQALEGGLDLTVFQLSIQGQLQQTTTLFPGELHGLSQGICLDNGRLVSFQLTGSLFNQAPSSPYAPCVCKK
eukprot:1137770-Pelagomonas_calceolata.AAC.17